MAQPKPAATRLMAVAVVLHFIGTHQADTLPGQLIVDEDSRCRHVADRDDVRPGHIGPGHLIAVAEWVGVPAEKHQRITSRKVSEQFGVLLSLDADAQFRLIDSAWPHAP